MLPSHLVAAAEQREGAASLSELSGVVGTCGQDRYECNDLNFL